MFPHSIIAAEDPTATIRAAPRPLAWEGREKTNDPERESPFTGRSLCRSDRPPKRNVRTFFVSLLEFLFHFCRIGSRPDLGRASGHMKTEGSMTNVDAVVTAVPDHYDGLRTLLLNRRDGMPKRLKQLAAFALEHPEDMAFGTVAGIAEHAGVQPSTLVRFAKSLGYEGFSHLQQIFRSRLRERFPDYRERLRGLRDTAGHRVHAASLLEGFADAASLSLERMRDSVSLEELS